MERKSLKRNHRRTISTPDMVESNRLSMSSTSSQLPDIVVSAISYINLYGLKVEGIFRVNGDLKLAETILERSKSGCIIDLDSELGSSPNEVNCRTVASLLKMYFRNSPEPLFPYPIYKSVLRYCRNATKLKQVIDSAMSKESHHALCAILRLCERVSKFANVNMMHPNALSICWGASLIKAPPASGDQADSMMFAAAMFVNLSLSLSPFYKQHKNKNSGTLENVTKLSRP